MIRLFRNPDFGFFFFFENSESFRNIV
ncbi:hypothetical protein CP8484711_1281, partial [Chlamydia psittaci 84-8471/1]